MNLIERYVRAVKKYLPNDLKEDVAKELTTNILDMLPEYYTEEDVYKVLTELGSPKKLAEEYNPNKKYLVGPVYYDKYISVLKLVIGIATVVSFTVSLFGIIVNPPLVVNYPEKFGDLVSAVVGGALQAALWVTIVFAVIERSGVDINDLHNNKNNKEWTPNDLPPLTEEKLKISRFESLFSIIVTILFTTLFYFNPRILALYITNPSNELDIIPLFNVSRLSTYLPFIIMLALVHLIIFIWKYIRESWNYPIAIVNAIYNSLVSLLIILMFSDSALFNSEFVNTIISYANSSGENVISWLSTSKWVICAFIVGINLWDSVSIFIKLSDVKK